MRRGVPLGEEPGAIELVGGDSGTYNQTNLSSAANIVAISRVRMSYSSRLDLVPWFPGVLWMRGSLEEV